jgi:hypothetical protein
MERSRLRKPSLSQNEDARPGDPAFLAPAANGTPRERKQPIPKHTQTREVSRYRVVVEVALYDRLEPLSGLGHGIVHALASLRWTHLHAGLSRRTNFAVTQATRVTCVSRLTSTLGLEVLIATTARRPL